MQKFKDEKAVIRAVLSQGSWSSDRLFEYNVYMDNQSTAFLISLAESIDQGLAKLKENMARRMRNSNYYYDKGFSMREEQKRLIEVSGKAYHILDYLKRPASELLEVFDPKEMSKNILVILYEYFTWTNDFDSAEKLLEKFHSYKKSEDENVKFSIDSDISNDFIPALRYGMRKGRSLISKETFSNYAAALKNKPKFCKNEANNEEYQKFIKFYKKEFSNVTSYSGDDRHNSKSKILKIKFFDLIESDFAAREKILAMKTWDDINIVNNLIKEDAAKLRQLVIEYFNRAHIDGKNPRKFIKIYQKVKDRFDAEKLEFIDVFQLNVKLQSLILMEML
jgi:hypothetical protein